MKRSRRHARSNLSSQMTSAMHRLLPTRGTAWAPWLLPIALIALWQTAATLGWLSSRYLPAPTDVLAAGRRLALSGELFESLGVSTAQLCRIARGRIARLLSRIGECLVAACRELSGHVCANDSQCPAFRADSTGHRLVRY